MARIGAPKGSTSARNRRQPSTRAVVGEITGQEHQVCPAIAERRHRRRTPASGLLASCGSGSSLARCVSDNCTTVTMTPSVHRRGCSSAHENATARRYGPNGPAAPDSTSVRWIYRQLPRKRGFDMNAVVYHGPGQKAWEEVPKPTLIDDTDAIVRVDAVTICGTDLHILKGDVPAVTPGRILGHEAVGTVEAVGSGVKTRQARRPGARVVHHRLRRLPLLPRGHVRPVPRRRRLDPRPQDRRHPGRVRPGAVRRHLHLPGARRRQRRAAADARRHPARPATRSACSTARSGPATSSPSSAPARSGCRRSWAPGSSARATSSPSTSPTAGSRRPSSSAPTSP